MEALENTVGLLSIVAPRKPIEDLWEPICRQIQDLPPSSVSNPRIPLVRAWVVATAILVGLGVFGSLIGFQWPATDPEAEAYLVGEYARFQQAQPVADKGGMSLLVGESFRRQVETYNH